MNDREVIRAIRTRIIVRLDQFLSWPPFIQIPVIVLLTIGVVLGFGLLEAAVAGTPTGESIWFALTRFLDGGAMSQDQGVERRTMAIAVTVSGVLIVSFLTGAFASKLGDRIAELRSGRSPIIAKDHILILGFDSKVPAIVRELARSSQRISVVVLAKEEKGRMDALLRFALEMPASKLKLTCRTGDPTSEVSLLRCCAHRAHAIVVTAPSKLDDERALRAVVSVLLSVRRAVGKDFAGRVVVESRLAIHGPLLTLTGEAGLAGEASVPMEVFASDDIVARVLAQSVRDAGVYFALRELLSFLGAEFYLESVPGTLVGKSFDEVHARVDCGIAVGVRRADGSHRISPPDGSFGPLSSSDHLIVLEENRSSFAVDGAIASSLPAAPMQTIAELVPQKVMVIGSNRTLPRLITELDRLLNSGSVVELRTAPGCKHGVKCENVELIHRDLEVGKAVWEDPSLYEADAVVVLGCEDEDDPEADASAVSLLLQLRHAQRASNRFVKRLITEVRDPVIARQIAASPDDFLVSTDVVAMLLAQAALDHRVAPIYREILDPTGVEIFLVPRAVYSTDHNARFRDIMAAARLRGEIAIGIFPSSEGRSIDLEDHNPVWLNPPRDAQVPIADGTSIVVLADPVR
jgi:ion channel POLLUX/CASTOR